MVPAVICREMKKMKGTLISSVFKNLPNFEYARLIFLAVTVIVGTTKHTMAR